MNELASFWIYARHWSYFVFRHLGDYRFMASQMTHRYRFGEKLAMSGSVFLLLTGVIWLASLIFSNTVFYELLNFTGRWTALIGAVGLVVGSLVDIWTME